MPKVVDHQERRIKLIEATWRAIVRDGWDAATMSAIATGAVFATGPARVPLTKEDLLSAAFNHSNETSRAPIVLPQDPSTGRHQP